MYVVPRDPLIRGCHNLIKSPGENMHTARCSSPEAPPTPSLEEPPKIYSTRSWDGFGLDLDGFGLVLVGFWGFWGVTSEEAPSGVNILIEQS